MSANALQKPPTAAAEPPLSPPPPLPLCTLENTMREARPEDEKCMYVSAWLRTPADVVRHFPLGRVVFRDCKNNDPQSPSHGYYVRMDSLTNDYLSGRVFSLELERDGPSRLVVRSVHVWTNRHRDSEPRRMREPPGAVLDVDWTAYFESRLALDGHESPPQADDA